MYKIKNSYIDRMVTSHLTNAEIDFLLYIARFQDDFGCVHSVYYKTICEECGMSVQKFYDILHSLTEKGMVSVEKPAIQERTRRDLEVTLAGNDFSDKDFSSGYLNVASIDFASDRFRGLKAGSKLLFLYMQRFTEGKHMFVQKFYEDFCTLFAVAKKTLRFYLHQLKETKLLGVSKKRNKAYHYEMTMKKTGTLNRKGTEVPHEKEQYKDNIRDLIKRNFGKAIPEENADRVFHDVVNLTDRGVSNEYARRNMISILLSAIESSLKLQEQENKSEAVINAALTNKFFSRMLVQCP